MEKQRFITILIILAVLLLSGSILYYKLTGEVVANSDLEEFAKYLGQNSELYVQIGCVHCKTQEDMFGDSLKYLTLIDCLENVNKQKCIDNNILLTPTWIINGEKYEGVQTIEKLKELTNYNK